MAEAIRQRTDALPEVMYWMSFPNRKTHFFRFLISSVQEAKDLIEKHRGEMVSPSNGASGRRAADTG